jgi:hypothetical protein
MPPHRTSVRSEMLWEFVIRSVTIRNLLTNFSDCDW